MLGINQPLLAMLSYLPFGLLRHAITRLLQIFRRQCSSLVDTTRGFRSASRFVCNVCLCERGGVFLIRGREEELCYKKIGTDPSAQQQSGSHSRLRAFQRELNMHVDRKKDMHSYIHYHPPPHPNIN